MTRVEDAPITAQKFTLEPVTSPEVVNKLSALKEEAENLRKLYGLLTIKPTYLQRVTTDINKFMKDRFGINTPIWLYYPGEGILGTLFDGKEDFRKQKEMVIQLTTDSKVIEASPLRIWNTKSFPLSSKTAWDTTYIEVDGMPSKRLMLPMYIEESRVEILKRRTWDNVVFERDLHLLSIEEPTLENLNFFAYALDHFKTPVS